MRRREGGGGGLLLVTSPAEESRKPSLSAAGEGLLRYIDAIMVMKCAEIDGLMSKQMTSNDNCFSFML